VTLSLVRVLLKVSPFLAVVSCIIMLSCRNDSDFVPSGTCRLSRIVSVNPGGESYEQVFTYDTEGKLVGYSMPYYGPECRYELIYDDNGRLLERSLKCGDAVDRETFQHFGNNEVLVQLRSMKYYLYYGDDVFLDSAHYTNSDDQSRETVRITYQAGQFHSAYSAAQPFGLIRRTYDVQLDSKINPIFLLKESAGYFGFEGLDFGVSHVNNVFQHNCTHRTRMWLMQDYEGQEPYLFENRMHEDVFTYQYIAGTDYVYSSKRMTDAVSNEIETFYVYEACH
jgi:hypothetical protein